jgi:hypothetical protein
MAYSVDSAIMSPAGKQESILTSGEHLAVVWRSKVCGYCAEGLKLVQMFVPYDLTPEMYHVALDGSYYPCACVVQMLEEREREEQDLAEHARLKAERDNLRLEIEESWRKAEGYSALQRLGYGSILNPTF